ncbi:alpha-ketoglutarate-dependent dioxygenase AlkB family protein [Salinarimonas ramus]|uniref:Alkylated DNA repair dioxygenase n=1 Tax=Salinarimonas ramus TaxID=690164 RepID=A0A917Q5C5_9HYPH|nr:alpha-ketoglutarate-dependent dioxygenase AlkB [Salinarimonas ramus]GGK24248.1 alkylated DNA repair dioxygenase [Salinarimonas ramus]
MSAPRLALAPGLLHVPGYLDGAAQVRLRDALRETVRAAPLFTPRMPRTGKPFSVRMTNCGALGWVSDEGGYRYQPTHPVTGAPWPPMPDLVRAAWDDLAAYPHPPEACLVNWYEASAKMGLHQDRDEADLEAPVVSLSLGDTAIFRFGGTERKAPTRSIRLASGDAVVIGGPSRLVFHGIDRILAGSSTLLDAPGRINLTLRRVTPPA